MKSLQLFFSIALLTLFLPTIKGEESVIYTKIWDRNIGYMEVNNSQTDLFYPIIDLYGDEQVILQFDDISTETNSYSYKIVHCNSDWTPSDLSEAVYLDGFSSADITDYTTSINTYFVYNHYAVGFPNDNMRPKISGNYAFIVYKDNDEDQVVLTARFFVVENKVGIKMEATPLTDISYKKDYQQVNIEVDYPNFNITDPDSEITTVVVQNGRQDNAVTLNRINYFQHQKLIYKTKDLIFEAGNEYRTFDISSERVLSDRVESIKYFKPYFHATLYEDEYRNNALYDFYEDVNGRFKINLQFSDYVDTESDYYYTHFALPREVPFLDGDVYLLGNFNHNLLTDRVKLTYNPISKQYETYLLLKQGGYNYLYLYKGKYSDFATLKEIEGNHWETENEYAAFVYYRPFGAQGDRLIGFSVTHSNRLY